MTSWLWQGTDVDTVIVEGMQGEVAVRQPGRPVRVMVRRDGPWWRAEISTLGVVRQARSLLTLDRQVRQLVGTAAVDYQFRTGDTELDRLVVKIRAARLALRRHEARVRQLTGRALMLPSGASGRDLAVLLGLSYQRIHQLMRRHDVQQSTVEGER